MREYLVEYDPEAENDLVMLRNWLIEIGSFLYEKKDMVKGGGFSEI